MAESLVMVVDEQDNPIGGATKQEIWTKGLRHRIVRAMIFNADGQVLIQKRDPHKIPFPGCYDNSIAGHVDVGNTYDQAMNREGFEELGVRGIAFKKLGFYRSEEVHEGLIFNRFTHCYTARLDTLPTTLGEREVASVAWWDMNDVHRLVREHPERATDGLVQVIARYYS